MSTEPTSQKKLRFCLCMYVWPKIDPRLFSNLPFEKKTILSVYYLLVKYKCLEVFFFYFQQVA